MAWRVYRLNVVVLQRQNAQMAWPVPNKQDPARMTLQAGRLGAGVWALAAEACCGHGERMRSAGERRIWARCWALADRV